LKSALDRLEKQVETAFPNLPNGRWVALRLLEGDRSIVEAARSGDLGNLNQSGGLDPRGEMSTALEAN
jgi:ferrous iron transport protein B